MSYQLPNGRWVQASGGFGQDAGGAWFGGGGGGGGGFGGGNGVFGGGFNPGSAYGGSDYSNFCSGAGRLANGRLYEPYFGPPAAPPRIQGPRPPIFPRRPDGF